MERTETSDSELVGRASRTGLIMACLMLAGCAPVRETPHGEAVVFSSERGGNVDIYMAATDGTAIRRLTSDPAPDHFARCSRDGRQVAFVRGEGKASQIWVVNLSTGEERRLTEDNARDSTPAWSPDSRSIYFTRRTDRIDRLAAINLDGGGVRFLTDGAAHDTMPDVSPDGRSLVHHTYRYGKESELQLLDLKTGLSRRLTETPGFDYEVAFAGDGRLVFSSDREGGHYRLYTLSLADRQVQPLADTGRDIWGGRSSRRSGSILFYTGAPKSWRLMRVDRGGGPPTPLIDDGYSNAGADWCPAFD